MIAALTAVTVGVGVLIGWFFRIEFLKRGAAGLVAMNPAAAIAFILAGASLALFLRYSHGEDQKSRVAIMAARMCALGVTLIGLFKIVAISTGWDLGVDQWLFHSRLVDAFHLPNRLSPNAALKFLLLGGALLGANVKNRSVRFGVEFAAAAVGFGSVMAIIGYAYGIESLYDIGSFIPIALPSAITFLVLTAGLLCSHTDDGLLAIVAGTSVGGTMARRLLPAAVVVPTVLGWLTLHGERAGYYRWEIGEATFVMASILVFTVLVCWSATGLFHLDLGRKKAEEARRESEERFAGTFEHTSIGVALVSLDGHWLKVNRALCESVGYAEAELLARTFHDITYPEDLEPCLENVRRMLAGEIRAFQMEKRYVHARGHLVNVLVDVSLVHDDQDRPLYFISQVQDITARKREEDELRWRTAFFEAMVNSTSDAILVTDNEARKIVQNQRYVELWKVPPAVAADSNNEQQLPWVIGRAKDPVQFVQRIVYLNSHPDESSQEEIEQIDGTVLDRLSAPVLGRDGRYFGRIWTYRDITARKQAEKLLRESEARYEHIAANVPGMVNRFVIRADGSYAFEFVSEGCRDIYGLEPEQLLSNANLAIDMVHEDDKANLERALAESAATLEPLRWAGRIVCPDTKKIVYIQAAARPERQANGDVVWDGVVTDVTERRQAEEDRRAKEEAERANAAKSEFLSRMSHELRTPLNAILGFGQLLELEAQTDGQHESVRHVIQAGRHLLKLIDEVLDISRVESGHMALSLEAVPIHEFVQETITLIRPLAQQREIAMLVRGGAGDEAAGHGPYVTADRQRLKQVLLNLLSNAVKYNVPGGRVTLEYTLTSNHLRLTVGDTGPGIPAEKRLRLFTPFDRLDAERGNVEGTGLGLALSKSLMEAMGGTLGLEEGTPASAHTLADDSRGPGAAFFLKCPLADNPLDVLASAGGSSTREAARVEALPAGRTLLYIEDNLSNLTLVERLMGAYPEVRLLTAMQGTLGLDLARQHRPDLILLDLHLPDMFGAEVLRRLRADESTRNIPTVIISADATERQIEHLRKAGAYEYLTKPIDLKKFLAVLREILVKGGATTETEAS